ncbi:hypothetical protein OZX62_02705 [Bifidobacterium sp. ESL0690]|uniref:hypothetical protein n=1 Tax=Bifidobacterium sp. ESL0690 TaxID=2983214 RepID=UPI0023F9566D|nr:hypothetical protein [Bifidobacterium sp. ESL0690]WEV47212.1 hypothetical protein OZX62_02705 [Bifidobacterium sp. ESL0690]
MSQIDEDQKQTCAILLDCLEQDAFDYLTNPTISESSLEDDYPNLSDNQHIAIGVLHSYWNTIPNALVHRTGGNHPPQTQEIQRRRGCPTPLNQALPATLRGGEPQRHNNHETPKTINQEYNEQPQA